MHLSRQSYALGIKLDYCGIILLMWGSTFPLAYYSFPLRAYTQIGYMAVTTILAGLCLLATFHQSVGGPHLGHVRAVLFGSFGLGSFLMPILHGLWLYGLAEQSPRIGLTWIIATALCNGVGVIAYAFKVTLYLADMTLDWTTANVKQFPEAYCPRRFDIFGASHQIMHIMVVLAALAYAKAVVAAFDHSHHQDTVYQQVSATAHP
jgi:adiponectin receptor